MQVYLSDSEITIHVQSIILKDYTIHGLSHLEDVVVNNYKEHTLIIRDEDGNNVRTPGFISWLDRLRTALAIPYNKIIFQTQIQPPEPYHWDRKSDFYEIVDIDYNLLNRDLSNSKFVGCLAASRWSIARCRLIYELDHAFAGDAFITCNPRGFVNFINQVNRLPENDPYYKKEIEWLNTRQFDNDFPLDFNGGILPMQTASQGYASLWNRYQIEIVCETDEYMNERFTDKVAKVLLTGKPFLLLCGQGSLQYLQDLGFATFGNFIDESYDDCVLPAQRISKIIKSLQELYKSPEKDQTIKDMYLQAHKNIEVYKSKCSTQFPKRKI